MFLINKDKLSRKGKVDSEIIPALANYYLHSQHATQYISVKRIKDATIKTMSKLTGSVTTAFFSAKDASYLAIANNSSAKSESRILMANFTNLKTTFFSSVESIIWGILKLKTFEQQKNNVEISKLKGNSGIILGTTNYNHREVFQLDSKLELEEKEEEDNSPF